MSRTWSHGKNFEKKYKEAFKNRAPGYEFWSARPYSNYGGCEPGKSSKRVTARMERARDKIIEEIEFVRFRDKWEKLEVENVR